MHRNDTISELHQTSGVAKPTVPTVCIRPGMSTWNVVVAAFTFANASSYPEDLVPFKVSADEDFLLQIDLENVGTRKHIEQLPTVHAACAAAGV